MGKRVDHDATQEVSASMLVPPDRKPPYPAAPANAPKNDASMWMQAPVNVEDFVNASKRPTAPKGSSNWIVGASAAIVVAGIAAGVWYGVLRESPKQTS